MNIVHIIYGSNKSGKSPQFGQAPDDEQSPAKAPGTMLRKVLVVDDEPDLADLAAILLSARGLVVLVAYSGHEAIRMLGADDEIDAVFSDIVMPGMTGLQLADAVMEMYPRVKIVLASGYTLPQNLMNRERPFLFTPKPYKIETVLKLLHS
jgi:two-component system OmpR family response regulator